MKNQITKIILSVAICLFSVQLTQAQSFVKGTSVGSLGIGLGGSLAASGYSASPAFSVNYEKGSWEVGEAGVISLGGYAGISSYKYTGSVGSYSYTDKLSYTIIGVRSAFHYGKLNNDKTDLYGGLMLGYNILSSKYSDNDPTSDYESNVGASGLGITAYVGGRYYFAEKLAAFAEAGYGVSYLTLGVSLKL